MVQVVEPISNDGAAVKDNGRSPVVTPLLSTVTVTVPGTLKSLELSPEGTATTRLESAAWLLTGVAEAVMLPCVKFTVALLAWKFDPLISMSWPTALEGEVAPLMFERVGEPEVELAGSADFFLMHASAPDSSAITITQARTFPVRWFQCIHIERRRRDRSSPQA